MDRSGPRLPSPWWVLLPGVLLALAGARAVSAEMDRARQEAREAASRVALAVATLVEEHSAPLAEIRSVGDVDLQTLHLFPTWVMTPRGSDYDVSAWRTIDPTTVTRDAALRDSVRARVESEPPGVAATVLGATAEAVETPWIAIGLRLAAAEADLEAGSPASALETLRLVFATPRGSWSAEVDDDAVAARALRLMFAAAGRDPVPDWVVEVAARGAAAWGADGVGEWEVPDAVRRRIDAHSHSQNVARARGARATVARHVVQLESAGRQRDALSLADVQSPSDDAPPRSLVVFVRATLERGPAWICGIVPSTRVEERLAPLETPDRRVVVHTPTGTLLGRDALTPASGDIFETVSVPGLAGWHVDVRERQAAGVPPAALGLAAAVVIATLALGLGAFALSRAARHHARLAEERRTFLDHVAHEVRTPAAALLALSEELERGHVEPERQQQYHELLLTESRRLAELVEETLDLTRLEGGRLVAKREPADLRDVLRDAIAAARPDEGRVVVTMPDTPVPVSIDRAAVRRALRNLIDNALKHGAAPAPVEVTLERVGGRGRVSVRDHGPGIRREHAAHVFDRFYRVPTKTHEVKGVGLGLALVREVAEIHGGTAGVTDAQGRGALFHFEVPLAREEST